MTCNNIVNSTYPSEWTQTRLKYLLKDKITDGPHETPVFKNEGIPFLSVDSIVNGKLIFDECRYISVDDAARYNKKCIPKKGNILMGKAASVGKIALIDTDKYFQIWSPLALLIPNDNSYSKYIKYFLESEIGQMQIDLLSTNNTQKNIAMEDIENIPICVPELYEQKLIADFLDRECGRLDSILDNLREQIETLEKYKESLIYETVTCGLDKTVDFKNVNLDWVDKIPKHWNLNKVKYLTNEIISGGTPETDEMSYWEYNDNKGIPWVVIGDMSGVQYVKDTFSKITIQGMQSKNLKLIPAGTLIYSIYATVGETAVLDIDATINQALLALIVNKNKVYRDFLKYSLIAQKKYILSFGSTSTQTNLNLEKVKNISISLPPLCEQVEIVNFLNQQVKIINNLIHNQINQVNCLENYKKSLIYEYVTGKKRIERSDS